MPIVPADRILQLPTGIFSELATRKQAARQHGLNVIDLSIGSPDLPPAQAVRNALADAVQDPLQYGYSLTGTQPFHDAVSYFYQHRYGVDLDPRAEVLQVAGSQDGLAHLSMALVNPGDVVLAPDPGYPIYHANVQIAGGQLYPMPLLPENGFLPNLDDIPPEIARQAKLMILNHPGNPVPSLATQSFFEQVVAFARRHNVLVVHDFAYSELVFDGQKAISFLSVPGAKDVGIELNSLSKTFNLAGARIGYVVGNRAALAALALLKSHLDYGVFLPIQHAATLALQANPLALRDQVTVYEARREALVGGLHRSGWAVAKPPATMFIWAKLPAGWTSRGFALALIEQAGVAVTPGDAFGTRGTGYVRMALVQSVELLVDAAQRIGRFLEVERPR